LAISPLVVSFHPYPFAREHSFVVRGCELELFLNRRGPTFLSDGKILSPSAPSVIFEGPLIGVLLLPDPLGFFFLEGILSLFCP